MDYARLGFANIRTHKKRASLAVATVGLIFGILTSGSLLIQGVENVVLDKMLMPTDGKILLEVSARQRCIQEECMLNDGRGIITRLASENGGEVLSSRTLRIGYSTVPVVESDILAPVIEVDLDSVPEDAIPVVASMSMLASWRQSSVPSSKEPITRKMQMMDGLRERSIGHEIIVGEQKLFVVGILPGEFGIDTLSLANAGKKMNPLNIILEQIGVGKGSAFLLDDGEQGVSGSTDDEAVYVMFSDESKALAYRRALGAEACSLSDAILRGCDVAVEFSANQVVGNSISAQESFAVLWKIYGWLAFGLSIVAGVVMISTYTRLIGDDAEKIALYRALGAGRWQVAGVYCVYLLILSLLAGLFALVIGVVGTSVVNLLNGQALSQVLPWLLGKKHMRFSFSDLIYTL